MQTRKCHRSSFSQEGEAIRTNQGAQNHHRSTGRFCLNKCLFKDFWFLTMVFFFKVYDVDFYGVVSFWVPLRASCPWCERTILWTSWAELQLSGSPPAAACCLVSGDEPPPAVLLYPLSPEHTHTDRHVISTRGGKNKCRQMCLIKALLLQTSSFLGTV